MRVLDQKITDEYAIYNGDSCEVIKGFEDNSMGFIIYSPPFDALYTFSNSDRDMSNSEKGEFMEHFQFLAYELKRVLKKGRMMAVHCQNIATTISKDGVTGIRDFRGELIRLFCETGFIFHSEICINKSAAKIAMRNKTHVLLHGNLVKDACSCRQALADFIIVFRKDGDNEEPVSGGFEYYAGADKLSSDAKFDPSKGSLNAGSRKVWERYADPVWTDIDETKVLNARGSKDTEDEKHISPLQLQVIERCIQIWTNENDTVFTPFLGIGSEVYQALKMGRKGVGIELKTSYFNTAKKNCELALFERSQKTLF
ncbi:DNA-methyltransferase [Campylobacter fetus]|uniref:Methyltransferase n=1 Tax=Campylobacter fetus subsp. testudinum TaxID=1507806 RepID=A0AAX0H9N3_CAMFE|nr:DNA methyltransferase [Campylobacter fetus]OCR90244.1 DNA methylase [Campylobacter fetus subsp. testudinum]OCR93834.1 DNA methylase [Campylobacter fetus subsp. testudinum]